MNGLIDANMNLLDLHYRMGQGSLLHLCSDNYALIVVVQYTCDSCYFPLKTFEVIPQEGEAAILVTENTFSVPCCLNL